MGYRPHGRAVVNASRPNAFAICDRCGGLWNHRDLVEQPQFNAVGLYNTRLLVCERCLDVPQPQFLNSVVGPDPWPVFDPRPENYQAATVDYLSTQDYDPLETQDDRIIVVDDASQNFSEEAE